jgi:hypothetical protein
LNKWRISAEDKFMEVKPILSYPWDIFKEFNTNIESSLESLYFILMRIALLNIGTNLVCFGKDRVCRFQEGFLPLLELEPF